MPYSDLPVSLDSRVPQHATFLNEATSLFRGASYLAYVGAVPPGAERGGIDIAEAALLSGSVGAPYQGVVVDIDSKDPRKGIVVIAEHAVRGAVVSDTDNLPLGEPVTVRLIRASIEERAVHFSYRK